jgi:hypothetical protein
MLEWKWHMKKKKKKTKKMPWIEWFRTNWEDCFH